MSYFVIYETKLNMFVNITENFKTVLSNLQKLKTSFPEKIFWWYFKK